MDEDAKTRLMGKDVLTGYGEAKFFRTPYSEPGSYISNTAAGLSRERYFHYMNEETVTIYYTEWLANNEVEIEDDTYQVHGILDMDETWGML